MRTAHPMAGKQTKIRKGSHAGEVVDVLDWWVNVGGGRVPEAAVTTYGIRRVIDELPDDANVLACRIAGMVRIVHASEV